MASTTTTPAARPTAAQVVALTTTPAQRKAAAQVASKVLAGNAPAVPGKRNSGAWQGKASAPVLAVARATRGTSTTLAASQVAALVHLAAGGVHHNPRVVARLAGKGLCTPQGAVTPAGAAVLVAVGKACK
jgi:hypothetical protein